MKSYTYTPDGDGKGKEGDIPADMAEAATKGHEALVEMVAEGNDALLEEFFAEGTLPVEHIVDGLRQAVRDMRIVPILCMSALHDVATDQVARFHGGLLSGSDRPRDRYGIGERHRDAAQGRRLRARVRLSCSRPLPTRLPAACRTSRSCQGQ